MTPSAPVAAASQPPSLAPSSPKETTPNPRLSAAPRPPDLPGTDPNAPPPPQQRRCGLHSNGLAPPLKGAATPQRCLAVGSPQPAEGKGQTGTNSIVFYLGGGREGGAPVPSIASSPHSPPARPHPVCVCGRACVGLQGGEPAPSTGCWRITPCLSTALFPSPNEMHSTGGVRGGGAARGSTGSLSAGGPGNWVFPEKQGARLC